jgi:hypothetical protein
MEKKYLINLECSINALAELIALGLEKHCTITKLEMFDQPAEEKKPALQVASHKIEFKHPTTAMPVKVEPVIKKKTSIKKIANWDVYEILKARFLNRRFISKDVYQQALRDGFDCTNSAISGHLSRMRSVGLIEQNGGNKATGFVYVINELKSKKDFTKAISGYNNKAKARERQRSAAKNGWFNLAEFQRAYNSN